MTSMTAHPRILAARYAFMATQAVIWIIVVPLWVALVGDIVQISLYCAITLAMFVYVPYALHITLHDRRVRQHRPFDHAGGEVAYLAVIMSSWLASLIWSILFLTFEDSHSARDAVVGVTVVLSLAQVVISCVWLGMIVWVVKRAPGTMKQTYRMSVNRLLRGGEPDHRPWRKLEPNESIQLGEMPQLAGNQNGKLDDGSVVDEEPPVYRTHDIPASYQDMKRQLKGSKRQLA